MYTASFEELLDHLSLDFFSINVLGVSGSPSSLYLSVQEDVIQKTLYLHRKEWYSTHTSLQKYFRLGQVHDGL